MFSSGRLRARLERSWILVLLLILSLFSVCFGSDIGADSYKGKVDEAWRYIQQGRYSEAMRISDLLISKGILDGFLIKSRIYFERGEKLKALQVLKRAKELYPDNPNVYFNIGLIYAIEALNPTNTLEVETRKVPGEDYQERMASLAKLYFQRALEYDPKYLPAAVQLAKLCQALGDKACFEEWTEYAQGIDKDNPQVVKLRAKDLEAKGKYATLRDLLEKHQDLVSSDPEVAKLLAKAYIETSEPEKARALLGKLLKEVPEDLDLYYMLGKLYGRSRAFQVEDYIKSLGLPKGKLFLALALFWEGIGDVEMALSYYTKALEVNPDDPQLYDMVSTYLLSQEKYNEAITFLQKLLKVRPDYKSYFLLGTAYRRAGDPQRAIDLLTQAKELNPSYPYTYIELSNAYLDVAFKLFNDLNDEGFKWYDKGIEVVREAIANVKDPKYKARFQKSLKQLIKDKEEIKKTLEEARRKQQRRALRRAYTR